ncbi:MAG: DUF3617 family protein [Desulfobacterales bacterium]
MMKKICAALITLLAAASVSHAAPDIKEGKWEITTKMEMPGMPMEMPPVTVTQCLTRKNMVPEDSDPGQECKTSDITISGNTISWTTTCSSGQDGPVTGTGNITYAGKTMKGTMKMKQSGMEMTSHIHGNYIGKCE